MKPLWSCLAVASLQALTALPTTGQSVHGVARDADRGRSLPGVQLYLLDAAGSFVDSTFTDRDGYFRLDAHEAGMHVLYFQSDGWVSVPSDTLRLRTDERTAFDFSVPLVTTRAFRQMNDMIASDARLQSALPEVCGEALRPWEAGLLVGVVRARSTREPIAGARVAVARSDGTLTRSTFSSETGIYILCNVPLGTAIDVITDAPGHDREITPVEIRAGMVSWYDLLLGTR